MCLCLCRSGIASAASCWNCASSAFSSHRSACSRKWRFRIACQSRSSFGVDPALTPLLGAQRPATVEAMFTICREQMTALFSSIRNLRTTSNSAIDEVCRFVTQNLAEPLTLTVAAEYVHMNPAYLSRVFKKETGQAFNAYVSEQRIRRAKQLLQTKDRIIDIAGNVGFENSKYFSQVFKKQTGMTPQEYRAAMQKEAEL